MHRRALSSLAAVSALCGLAGCNLIFGIQGGELVDGGTGGSGTGGDAATTSAGTGGAGGGLSCMLASDCPIPGPCAVATCEGGSCAAAPLDEGTVVPEQTPGDCKESRCDGDGNVQLAVDDTDVPDDMEECTDDVCAAGVPDNANTTLGIACGAAMDLACDGEGQCTGCTLASQCTGVDDACKTKTCTAGACGFSLTPAGALPVALQTTGDCQTAGCDGFGVLLSTDAAADFTDDGNNCTEDLCEGDPLGPTNDPEPIDTPCGATGLCDGAGDCVGCNLPTDCGTTTACRTYTCVAGVCATIDAPTTVGCSDLIFCNGTESCDGAGFCGNSAGNPCPADADGDCQDGCNEAAQACTANTGLGASCSNGVFCDGSETCNGNGACVDGVDPCPGDDVGPGCGDSCNEALDNCTANDAGGTPCRAAVPGGCDLPESCTGTTSTCPADLVRPNGTACGPAPSGACDVADSCNGVAATCPDAVAPSTVSCRTAIPSGCDVTDYCNGSAKSCPADAVMPSGTVCRAATSGCDPQEACNGGPVCPFDATTCQACFSTSDVLQQGFGLDPAKPQYTRCESVSFSGQNVTCTNPTIRFGSNGNGVPVNNTENNYNAWCQQLGCAGYVTGSVVYGERSLVSPFGAVWWCNLAMSDIPNVRHWCDLGDFSWYNGALDYHPTNLEEIVSVTCVLP